MRRTGGALVFLRKKLIFSAGVLLVMSILIFAILAAAPGNFAQSNFGRGLSAERIQALERIYGLDLPVYERYFHWFTGAVQGDFGISFLYKKPVIEVIGRGMQYSFAIAFFAFLLELFLAVPLGIWSAVKRGKMIDRIVAVLSVTLISLPVFLIGILLKKWFAFDLNWLPASGTETAGVPLSGFAMIWDRIGYGVLPCLTLALAGVGSLTRYIRSLLSQELGKDYITAARVRWLPERKVVLGYAFRNIRLPLLTYIASALPLLFSGAVIVESLFGIPGVGRLAYQAALARDYPLLMGFTVFLAGIVLVTNIITDLLYRLMDRRIGWTN